jgi:hypothetical protein
MFRILNSDVSGRVMDTDTQTKMITSDSYYGPQTGMTSKGYGT